jgi:transposase
MYTDILRRLGDAVRRKRPEKWSTNIWFPLHNVPTHLSVLVKDFLAKKKVTTLEHPLYSPDLATAEVYLFPQLKSPLKGRSFCYATDTIKNATKELKRLSQNGFPLSQAYSYTRRLF